MKVRELLEHCRPFTRLGIFDTYKIYGNHRFYMFSERIGVEVIISDESKKTHGIRYSFNLITPRQSMDKWDFYKCAYSPESVREKIKLLLRNEKK